MRKIKDVLRLHFDSHLGQRPIGLCLGLSRTTVGDYLRRAVRAGLSWPLPDSLSDQELEQRLFPPVVAVPTVDRQLPDWSHIHTELKRKGVSLMLLWEEYQANNPQAYRYNRFCQLYRAWAGKQLHLC
jgi:transposase